MAKKLVIKVTAGADAPERCSQAFTVAAVAVASGVEVSLWLTGESAWFALPGRRMAAHEAIVVIVEAEGRKLALQIDDLVGQQQVVIKSLETNYRRVRGVSGATILGDGRVALIVDVVGVVRLLSQQHNSIPIAA